MSMLARRVCRPRQPVAALIGDRRTAGEEDGFPAGVSRSLLPSRPADPQTALLSLTKGTTHNMNFEQRRRVTALSMSRPRVRCGRRPAIRILQHPPAYARKRLYFLLRSKPTRRMNCRPHIPWVVSFLSGVRPRVQIQATRVVAAETVKALSGFERRCLKPCGVEAPQHT